MSRVRAALAAAALATGILAPVAAQACTFRPDLLVRSYSSSAAINAYDLHGCGFRNVAWPDRVGPEVVLGNSFVTEPSWLRGGRSFVYGWTHGEAFVADRAELRISPVTGRGSRTILQLPVVGMVTEVAASPDGRRIAFSVWTPNYPVVLATWTGIGSPQRIYVVNADGSGLQSVSTVSATYDASPVWSPDGRRLAFTSDRGPTSVYVTDLSATGLLGTRISPLDVQASSPRWSPDGRLISFQAQALADPLEYRPELWTARPDGSQVHRVLVDAATPSWAPDSRRLVVTREHSLAVVDVVTGRSRDITWGSFEGGDYFPSWSPDGRAIAFSRSSRSANGIWVVRPDGRGLRLLVGDEYGTSVWRR